MPTVTEPITFEFEEYMVPDNEPDDEDEIDSGAEPPEEEEES